MANIQRQSVACLGFPTGLVTNSCGAENLISLCRKGNPESGNRKLQEALQQKMAMWECLKKSETGGYYSLTELDFLKDDLQNLLNEINQGKFKIDLDAGGMRFLPEGKG